MAKQNKRHIKQRCFICQGKGYTALEQYLQDSGAMILEDCHKCGGTGKIMIHIIDRRVTSKKVRLNL